jgi:hypothetical protein
MRITHHAWRVATVIMLLAATAAYAAPPGQTKSPSGRSGSILTLAEARKFLQGRWALESFEVRPPGKEPIFPKGSGVLNYDDFGNMRVEIRADEASSDLLRAAGESTSATASSRATVGQSSICRTRPSPTLSRGSGPRCRRVGDRLPSIGRGTGRSLATC